MDAIRGYDDWRTMGPPEADEATVDVECPGCDFAGEVEGLVGATVLTWHCPDCGTRCEEDAEARFGPDPDYAHDDR